MVITGVSKTPIQGSNPCSPATGNSANAGFFVCLNNATIRSLSISLYARSHAVSSGDTDGPRKKSGGQRSAMRFCVGRKSCWWSGRGAAELAAIFSLGPQRNTTVHAWHDRCPRILRCKF